MAKKTFKGTTEHVKTAPALSFISDAASNTTEDGREIKSKRLNLLIKPTLYRNIEKVATMERISTNELINRVLEKYTREQAELIAKYDETFKEGV
jgi:predicted HicB family RNase H-like nuclease